MLQCYSYNVTGRSLSNQDNLATQLHIPYVQGLREKLCKETKTAAEVSNEVSNEMSPGGL